MRILNYILPIALVGGVAFWAYRKLKNANPVSNMIVGNVLNKPLGGLEAKKYAQDLYVCMSDIGTWNLDLMDEIYEKLNAKKGAFTQVYKEFGFANYAFYGTIWGLPFLGDSIDLIEWLRRELSGKRLDNWLSLAKKEGF